MAQANLYTDELGDKICEKISNSTIGLRHICDELNIGHSTVRAWIADINHPMSDKYARAKKIQISLMAEEILDIADDGSNDLMTIVKGDVEYTQENKEVTGRSKIRVDARKWLLSKLAPKEFGDKIEVENTHHISDDIVKDLAAKLNS